MSLSIKNWQDPVKGVVGLWLIGSPWILGYQSEVVPTWNAVTLGILVAAVALIALYRSIAWMEWVNVALGVWLVISAWLLGFGSVAMALWNAVIAGVVVAALALWALANDKNTGGWWRPAT
jgi:hypothetical protein